MQDNNNSLDSRFQRAYSALVLSRPVLVVIAMTLLAIFFGFQATKVRVDASADALVLEGDEDLEFYRQVVGRYGSKEWLVVAYQPKEALLTDASLLALSTLVDDLSAIEGVDSIMSLLDVPLLYSPKISVSSFSSGIKTLRSPSVDRELVAIELKISPIYRELLSSQDGGTAALQIYLTPNVQLTALRDQRERLKKAIAGEHSIQDQQMLSKVEADFKAYSTVAAEKQQRLVASVREVIQKHRVSAKAMFLGGVPMIANDMITFVQNDLKVFGLAILLFIVVLLAVIFRTPRWVILPLLSCTFTNVYMLGVLGMFDWRMTVVSSNFVALLLIVTLAISVHLVVRYRELAAIDPDATSQTLAFGAATSMFKPCLYTALTTIVAFLSLIVSGIRPIIDFGWMMTVGVFIALAVNFILLPAGMAMLRAPSSASNNQRASDQAEPALTRYFAVVTQRRGGWIVGVSIVLLAFAMFGVMRLKVENRFIDYFDENTEIYQGMELIDSKLGGTIPLDIMLFSSALGQSQSDDTSNEFDDDFGGEFDNEFDDEFGDGKSTGTRRKEVSRWFTRTELDKVQSIHRYVDSLDETGKVLSLATVYEVAADLLGSSIDDIQLSLAYNSLPDSIHESLITPYLNAETDEARITVRVKETSRTLNRAQLLENLHTFMQDEMGLTPDQYRFTGMLVLYNNMLQSLFSSQIMTLGMVFIAIVVMLTFLFRSLVLAVICIAPNILAALVVLGGMGWYGLPLDMMTITIAAISVGIGVDNTIHYVHRYRKEFDIDRNYLAAMYRSHNSIGRAMYYTSVIIIFGFSILTLSNFNPSIYFGLLTGLAMFSALLGALMLLPKLMMMIKPLGVESLPSDEN